MASRRLLVSAALALLGLAGAALEASLVHTDDGCLVETHCNACLLQLRIPVVITATFSLPRAEGSCDRVVQVPAAVPEDTAPKRVSSRGPPPA
jgi:hypothetical protein